MEQASRLQDDGVIFRSMRLEDIPAICRIEAEAFATPWTAPAFRNELLYNHFAKYLVVEMYGNIIGYGGMWVIIDEAHVTNIAIASEYRGKKLGERLLARLQQVAISAGATKMTLEVRVSNRIAQNLYKKMGFYPSGLRRNYYSDNHEDALIMWADLANRG
ncbi:MAG TPA: ribosomal protein S18-alanine N-acetyltransferase [Bacilli bacterium]